MLSYDLPKLLHAFPMRSCVSGKCPGIVLELSRKHIGNFQEYFLEVPNMSRKFPGHVQEMSSTFLRNAPELSWKFLGNVLDISRNMSWSVPGFFPENSRLISLTCSGNVLETSSKCPRNVLDKSWTCSRNVVEFSLIRPGKFQDTSGKFL